MDEGTPVGTGRYRILGTMPSTMPHVVRNIGRDTILDRDVTVLSLTEKTPNRQAMLESASRAVLVEDPRVVRVLDVESASPGYIVTEPISGTPLTALVKQGLTAQQARTIVGETAQTLDIASRRGLHHLALSPNSVRIDAQGQVRINGIGIEAALAGTTLNNDDPLTSDRADARALVSMLYYTHTGRWPGKVKGVPASPMAQGKPVAPSSLAPDVPAYVDELCERTWSDNPPLSAAEVVSELSAWEPLSIVIPDAPAPPESAKTAASSTSASAPVKAGIFAGVLASSGAAVGAVGGALSSAGDSAKGMLQRLRPSAASAESAQLPTASGGAVSSQGDHLSDFAETDQSFEPENMDSAQELDPEEIEEVKQVNHATNLVLATLAVLVLVGMFMAITNLVQLSRVSIVDDEIPAAQTVPTENVQTDDDSDEEDSKETEPTEEPTEEAVPIVISEAESLDPFGDNDEHPELTYALTDGDTSTMWYSRYYASASLAYKQGIGVAVHLEEEAAVSSVTILGIGEGGQVQIRATSADDPTGGTLLTEGSFTAEETTFVFDTTELDTLVIWVTEMPLSSDGLNKLTITEITLD